MLGEPLIYKGHGHAWASLWHGHAPGSAMLLVPDTVYIQLVPRAKNWARATIINVISNRTYKVQTTRGGIYWRNRRFIKSRHSDSRQSLKTVPDPHTIQWAKPQTKEIHQKTRETYRINESNTDTV